MAGAKIDRVCRGEEVASRARGASCLDVGMRGVRLVSHSTSRHNHARALGGSCRELPGHLVVFGLRGLRGELWLLSKKVGRRVRTTAKLGKDYLI